jgi:hypothetical protein
VTVVVLALAVAVLMLVVFMFVVVAVRTTAREVIVFAATRRARPTLAPERRTASDRRGRGRDRRTRAKRRRRRTLVPGVRRRRETEGRTTGIGSERRDGSDGLDRCDGRNGSDGLNESLSDSVLVAVRRGGKGCASQGQRSTALYPFARADSPRDAKSKTASVTLMVAG